MVVGLSPFIGEELAGRIAAFASIQLLWRFVLDWCRSWALALALPFDAVVFRARCAFSEIPRHLTGELEMKQQSCVGLFTL
jgi:hypothetical protein